MHMTNLCKVAGSMVQAVPPVILELLELKAGAMVGVSIEGGPLVVEPCPRPHYTLAELLAQCGASAEQSVEDQEWLPTKPVGAQLL